MAATSRVEINRRNLDTLNLALADGLFAVMTRILGTARPPDAPPYGQGLVERGGAAVWAYGKKVDGTTIGGRQIAKPRALKTRRTEITGIVGFGFPGRFQEFGTVRHRAQPFLAPAVDQVVPNATGIMRVAIAPRLARIP